MVMSAIFDWFKSSSEPTTPADWTDLWRILAPLGGRTGAEDLERLKDALAAEPEEKVEAARQQMLRAISLLDTEVHAAHLRWHPWQGPEVPFRRTGFLATLQRVIAAGPEAMERVLAEPAHLFTYDEPTPDFKIQMAHAAFDTPLELIDGALDTTSDIEYLDKSWPSLAKWWGDFHVFEPQDPDHRWLFISHPGRYTGPGESPEEGTEAWTSLDSWYEAADAATLQILAALDAVTSQELATPLVWIVGIYVAPQEHGVETSAQFSDGILLITRLVDEGLLDAVCSTQQRTNFLVQQTAQAMLATDLVWAKAAVLEELARPREF